MREGGSQRADNTNKRQGVSSFVKTLADVKKYLPAHAQFTKRICVKRRDLDNKFAFHTCPACLYTVNLYGR